jgi:NAD(P)-dependent dehydrogenase (short-subunit alcohol dehydrogenase family)
MSQLRGKVAVVTGGGSGIGRSLALALAREGMSVLVADIEQGNAVAVAEEIRANGGTASGAFAEVSDLDSVRALEATASDTFGPTYLLCSNAGVVHKEEVVSGYTPSDWSWMLGVNLGGVVNGVQAFVPGMLQRRSGHLLHTASAAGLVPQLNPGLTPYTVTKYGVVGLSENLRKELPPEIGVSVLCPGVVATPIFGSESHRPVAHGGTGPRGLPTPAHKAIVSDVGPDLVAELAVEGVKAGDLYIFTHLDFEEKFRERVKAIDQAFAILSARLRRSGAVTADEGA